jgi:hypothetical protein
MNVHLLVDQLILSLLLAFLLVFVLLTASCMLKSMSTVDYTFQQMEHGSSQTQGYSLWSAKLATHMPQPAQITEVFSADKLEFVCWYICHH